MSAATLLGAPISERDPIELLKELSAGLPSMTLKRFKRATGLADENIAELLGVGGRTLTRLKAAPRLPADLSDRLYAVASVYALAERVFDDRTSAIGWLGEPQFALRGRPPRQFLSTELGRHQVTELLNQIEHGLLA